MRYSRDRRAQVSTPRRFAIFSLVFTALAACDLIRLDWGHGPIPEQILILRYAVVLTAIAALLSFKRSARTSGIQVTHLSWIGFGALALLSGFAQADLTSIGTGIWMMTAVPILFGWALPRVLGSQGIKILVKATIGAGLPYILYSLAVRPIGFPYMGVTANPNSMGVIAAGTTTALIAVLVATLKSKQPWLRLIVTVSALTSGALVIASGSRTSFFAVACSGLVAAGACYPILFRRPGRVLAFALAGLLGLTTILLTVGGQALEVHQFIAKFNNPRANVLNYRDDIWVVVWEQRSVLGHGSKYFQTEVGVAAHNSVIEMLGTYGVLAATGLIVVALSSLYATFHYYLRNRGREPYALSPLLIAVCFWTLAGGEGMVAPLGGAVNLAFFLMVGLTTLLPAPVPAMPMYALSRVPEEALASAV